MHIVLTCACVPKVVTIKQRLSHMFLVKFLHLCSYLWSAYFVSESWRIIFFVFVKIFNITLENTSFDNLGSIAPKMALVYYKHHYQGQLKSYGHFWGRVTISSQLCHKWRAWFQKNYEMYINKRKEEVFASNSKFQIKRLR